MKKDILNDGIKGLVSDGGVIGGNLVTGFIILFTSLNMAEIQYRLMIQRLK